MEVPIFKSLLVCSVAGAGLFLFGVNSGADELRERQAAAASATPTKPVIKVVEQEVTKLRTVYRQPDSCARAVELATEVYQAVADYEAAFAGFRQITDHLGAAINMRDMEELNAAKTNLFKHTSAVSSPISDLTTAHYQLNRVLETCDQEAN